MIETRRLKNVAIFIQTFSMLLHGHLLLDIQFGHASRIFTSFNDKHENLIATKATETLLNSEIGFSLFLIRQQSLKIILSSRDQTFSNQCSTRRPCDVCLQYSFFLKVLPWWTSEVLLLFWGISQNLAIRFDPNLTCWQ